MILSSAMFLLFSVHAHSFSVPELKTIFCPLNLKLVQKSLDREYLEHGGAGELRNAIEGYQKQFGKCLDLKLTPSLSYELFFKEASVPLELIFSEGKKIKSAFLGMPQLRNDSLEKILLDIKQEPYAVSFILRTDETQEIFSHEADKPLSISRANQIFLLRAVKAAIEEGKLKLSDLVQLQPELVLPSFGILQDWKPGTLLSVDSLMNFMVSEKDLSASDLLLSQLDPAAFIRFSKTLDPFLSYREYFLLAELPKEKIGERTGLPNLLQGLKGMPPPKELRLDRIDLLDRLGWFASTREICASALAVRDDILLRNERLNREYHSVQSNQVVKYALVQSRDSGISQMTVLFQTVNSTEWKCISLTANHRAEIEESFFFPVAARLMNLAITAEKK